VQGNGMEKFESTKTTKKNAYIKTPLTTQKHYIAIEAVYLS
jgi:hypothetical protein